MLENTDRRQIKNTDNTQTEHNPEHLLYYPYQSVRQSKLPW